MHTLYDEIAPALREYVEQAVLPRYDAFDAAHRRDHALLVMSQSLKLVATLRQQGESVDVAMAWTIAAFHDTGMSEGRAIHHLASGRIIRHDTELRRWFSEEQIEVMAQAVEDHRASALEPPRSIYGRIVAEADRHIDPETIIRRTIQYGLEHYPALSRDEHYRRTVEHLREKYGPGGYLRLWFPHSPNAARLQQLHQLMADERALNELFDRLFTQLTTADHTRCRT